MGRREQHIRELGAQMNVPVEIHRDGRTLYGSARAEGIKVVGWDASNAAYFVALHELGHHAREHMPATLDSYYSRVLEAEAEAWEWAFDNTREKATAKTHELIATAWLGSYARDGYSGGGGDTFRSVASRVGLDLVS